MVKLQEAKALERSIEKLLEKQKLTLLVTVCLHAFSLSCSAALDSRVTNEKKKPLTVVVYRDGVGDGQLQDLLGEELWQFQKFFGSRWV